MKIHRPFKALVFAALCAAVGLSQAVVTPFNSQSAFNAAVQSPGFDSFDDLVPGDPLASPTTRSAGAYAYTAAASTFGFFGAGSSADAWLSTDQFSDAIVFDGFSAGVGAIGGLFFGSDLFGELLAGQSIFLEATDADGTLTMTLDNAMADSFFGFVSDGTLLSLRVSAESSDQFNVWPTINNLVLAGAGDPPTYPIPEPTSLALAAFGLAVGLRWRRRS